MKNMFKMINEAASLRRNMNKIQEQLREIKADFSGGGGKVTVTARGDGSLESIRIDPSVIDPSAAGVLEKLVLAAVAGALEAARKKSATEMQTLMQDLGLPNIPGL